MRSLYPSGQPGRKPQRRIHAFQFFAIVGAIISLIGFGGNLAAAQGSIAETVSYDVAMADGVLCIDGVGCGEVSVYVGPGKFGEWPILCLGLNGPEIFGEACADVSGTFSIDGKHLTYAELAPTALTFELQECDKFGNCSDPVYRDVTVSASWTAVGNRTPIQENLGNPHGPCTDVDIVNGFFQEAVVTVVVDGVHAEASGNLQSIKDHQLTRTNCG